MLGPMNVGLAEYVGPAPSQRLPNDAEDIRSYGDPYSGPTMMVASFGSQSVPLLSNPKVWSKPST